jgi:hypothetical protein
MPYVDLPERSFFSPPHFVDCYRSSSPACSASCPNHGRKRTNSSPRHSFRDFSLRTPAIPLPPRPHVHRPIGVGTPKKRGTRKRLAVQSEDDDDELGEGSVFDHTTPLLRPSTFRGGGPPPKASMEMIRICGTLGARGVVIHGR